MTKIIISVERLKKEVLDVELEIKDGDNVENMIEKFKEEYTDGKYHNSFDDYGPKDCDVCFQQLTVYDEQHSTIYIESLDPIPEKGTMKKKKF